MIYLFISLLTLLLGVVFAPRLKTLPKAMAFGDGFVTIFVCGLVLLHIFPHAFNEIEYWSLLFFFFGLLIPFFLERIQGASSIGIVLFGLGFAVHAFLDGVGLHVGDIQTDIFPHTVHASDHHEDHHHAPEHSGSALVFAVITHRIPIALFLGFTAIKKPNLAYTFAVVIAMATILGFAFGADIPEFGIVQAVLAGILLHVISGHSFITDKTQLTWMIRIFGGVCGGSLLLLIVDHHCSSFFLDIWTYLSVFFLVGMLFYLPKNSCISSEQAA